MLLDTSGLLCLLDDADVRRGEADTLYRAANDRLTHNYVLAELVALGQTRRVPRDKVLTLIADLIANPTIELVWTDELTSVEALDLLKARRDKQYSLCDAVSFVLMRQFDLADALTTDHHFEQEGFVRLLPQ